MDATVQTAVAGAISDASSLVTSNIPAIIAVAALFVGIKYGKKILGRI